MIDFGEIGHTEAFEDMQYRLYVLERIREGLKSIEEHGGIPHAEVKKRLAEWRNR